MRYVLFVTALGLFFGVGIKTFASDEEEEKETVYKLQQQGWEIVESTIREESLSGLPPYAFLSRVISITTYWLQRSDDEIVCEILYDSQLDRQLEECGEIYKILAENG